MDATRLLDLLANGAIHAETPETRDSAAIIDSVCAEIAAGADVTDACAACAVAPAVFLAWTVDDDSAATAYARALKIRARLLADAPIAAARAVRREREAGARGPELASVVAAVKAEAELAGQVAERGEPTASVKMSETSVRITFDPLPVHHALAPTDTQPALPSAEQRKLSEAVPAVYVVADELDSDA
ncbi:hypothetical protein [Gemmatimonas sp.]|uniref:terminase small subunit-like protein n=1 Tax=Gemmatimonas sp. TaxID=1962908 RepID=UPI0025BCAB6E|nr:hypothetical protein [Gemmatimonas sp.]MCA2990794.1 hypothetical protein [Gemmatimonas sp.]